MPITEGGNLYQLSISCWAAQRLQRNAAGRHRTCPRGATKLRYYHTTNAAESILVAGFRDNSGGQGLQGITLTGVFVGEQPLDGDESVAGEKCSKWTCQTTSI